MWTMPRSYCANRDFFKVGKKVKKGEGIHLPPFSMNFSRERTFSGRRAPLGLVLFAVLVASSVLIPLLYLVVRALEADGSSLGEIVFRERNLTLLGNTFLLAISVLIGTTLLALPMAWLLARVKLPFLRFWVVATTLPLAVPGYVGAFALLAASGSGGTLETIGLSLPRPSGFWGATWILTLYSAPYLFVNLYAALQNTDPALEEAAQSLGHSRWQSFWRVTVPQLRPALLSGALLITLHVLGDFGVVSLMRFETFSYAIYSQYISSLDRVYAAWLALILLLITVAILGLEGTAMRRVFLTRNAKNTRLASRVTLGIWSIPMLIPLVLYMAVAVVLPVITAIHWMAREPESLFYNPWAELLKATLGTLSAAVPAAILSAICALPLAYLAVRHKTRFSSWLERSSYLGYATPPLALALALIFVTLRIVPDLYQTLWLLIFAYTVHFLAESIGPIRSQLHQTPVRLEEAARSLGLRGWQVIIKILVPLLARGVLAGIALAFLSAAKELPITTLLAPPGFESLAKNVYGYTSEAMFGKAAPHALALILVSSAFIGLVLPDKRR
jgi:iron(III) transport system permease protein